MKPRSLLVIGRDHPTSGTLQGKDSCLIVCCQDLIHLKHVNWGLVSVLVGCTDLAKGRVLSESAVGCAPGAAILRTRPIRDVANSHTLQSRGGNFVDDYTQ